MLGCQVNNVFKIMYMEAVFAKIVNIFLEEQRKTTYKLV